MIKITMLLAVAGVLAVSLTISVPECMADEVRRIDPAKEKGLTSPEDELEVVLAIKNMRATAISTYWIDYDGNRVQYQNVKAGQEAEQITFEGHYWVIVNSDGKALGIYVALDKDGVILVK